MKTLEERFWAKVDKDGPNRCWDWTACTSSSGYGQIKVDGKMKLAHRVSYELHNGPIPEGLCVLHKCDRPRCVNPDCLFLGTHSENMIDMKEKGRGWKAKGSAQGNSKLNESQVSLIKNFLARDLGFGSCAFLGRWFEVNRETISEIKHGRCWSHIK